MVAQAPILSMRDVAFRWSGQEAFALNIPAFSLKRGETALLLGESGSGKSTLLSLICGTVSAASGVIEVDAIDLATLSAAKRDSFRAETMGLIFQQFNLLPYASVLDNILLPLRFAPNRRARVAQPKQEAVQLCRDLGLAEPTLQMKAAALSVGQQQRVAAARALIGGPPLVIADEPTSALDAHTQAAFLDLLFAQVRRHNSTLLMVSHDARLGQYFDRVIEMGDVVSHTGAAQ